MAEKFVCLKNQLTSKLIAHASTANETVDESSVKSQSRELAYDVIMYWSYPDKPEFSTPCNQYAKTLRRSVAEVTKKHEILFTSMIKKLSITRKTGHTSFYNVTEELFADNRYNWGRVVTVYAFSCCLARYSVEHDMADYVDSLIELTGNFVSEKLSSWIVQQGGWDAMVKFFPEEENPDRAIWQGLLCTLFGLGALATMYAIR